MKLGIAGVQDFIAASRKVSDLVWASRTISQLMNKTIKKIEELHHLTLVLPGRSSGAAAVEGMPQQIIVQVHADGPGNEQVDRVVDELETHVRGEWLKLFESVLHAANSSEFSFADSDRDLAWSQIESLLELYWVIASVPKANGLREISRLHDSRRLTRTFTQTDQENLGVGWTCSVCGNRSAVVMPPAGKWRQDHVRLRGAEKLCGPCLARRYGGDLGVSSTHRLARYRFFVDERFKRWRSKYEVGDWNYVLDNLDDLIGCDVRANSFSNKRKELILALRNDPDLVKALQKLSPYYAIIHFDGDHMGQWLFDRLSTDADPWSGPQGLSERLGQFAEEVRKQVNDPSICVYAAGDDGLILATLDDLIGIISKIHECWERTVASGLPEHSNAGVPTLTLHAMALHAKTPLQPALHEVRRAIAQTKHKANRNAVSIAVAPRSGAQQTMMMRWGELPQLVETVESLTTWRHDDQGAPTREDLASRRREQLAMSSFVGLLDRCEPFFRPTEHRAVFSGAGLEHEVRRHLLRSGGGGKALSSSHEAMVDWLYARALVNPQDSLPGTWGSFASAIRVCSFLARLLDWGE